MFITFSSKGYIGKDGSNGSRKSKDWVRVHSFSEERFFFFSISIRCICSEIWKNSSSGTTEAPLELSDMLILASSNVSCVCRCGKDDETFGLVDPALLEQLGIEVPPKNAGSQEEIQAFREQIVYAYFFVGTASGKGIFIGIALHNPDDSQIPTVRTLNQTRRHISTKLISAHICFFFCNLL
jgi:hypothetical protein